MNRSGAAAVLAGLLSCAASVAQDVHVLMPDSFAVRPRESVALRMETRRDTSSTGVDWPKDRVRWYFARGGGTQENRDAIDTVGGNARIVAQPVENAGTTVIGIDFKPVIEPWDATAFRIFAEKSLSPSEIKPERQPPSDAKLVRINRIETAKTIVRAAIETGPPRDDGATTALSKTGQSVEIRLLANPFDAALGSDIPIKTYVRGDKRGGVRAIATCLADGASQAMITDPTGTAHFTLNRAGKWLVEFHTAERSDSNEADWTLHSATLTFEVNP